MPRPRLACLACYVNGIVNGIVTGTPEVRCDHPDLGMKQGDTSSIGVLSNWSPPGKADLRTIPVVDGMQVLWIPGKATYVGKIPELEETPVTMSAEPVGFVTTETETGERCRHRASTECRCKCHTWPLLHDRACCEVCPGCGFRSMLEGA
jgi:hypothetical protein